MKIFQTVANWIVIVGFTFICIDAIMYQYTASKQVMAYQNKIKVISEAMYIYKKDPAVIEYLATQLEAEIEKTPSTRYVIGTNTAKVVASE